MYCHCELLVDMKIERKKRMQATNQQQQKMNRERESGMGVGEKGHIRPQSSADEVQIDAIKSQTRSKPFDNMQCGCKMKAMRMQTVKNAETKHTQKIVQRNHKKSRKYK